MKPINSHSTPILLRKRVLLFAVFAGILGGLVGKYFLSKTITVEETNEVVVVQDSRRPLEKLGVPSERRGRVANSGAFKESVEDIEIYLRSELLGYRSRLPGPITLGGRNAADEDGRPSLVLNVPASAEALQKVEVYEIGELTGQQVYYASHIKPEALKDPKKVDDEDRAALIGAIGKTGIAMPLLQQPHVSADATVSSSKLTITTSTMDDGQVKRLARLDHKQGKDDLIFFDGVDTITCLLLAEGVTQIYTIHRNVHFPDGEWLVTMQTTRNRPLGVSTLTVSGKAKRIK